MRASIPARFGWVESWRKSAFLWPVFPVKTPPPMSTPGTPFQSTEP